MNKNHIGRKSQGVESNNVLVDGKSCLASETGSKNLIEETHHFIRFGRSFTESRTKNEKGKEICKEKKRETCLIN
jgi:hypothetical protein